MTASQSGVGRYIYADSESVGAVVETPKLLKLLVDDDGNGLEGADGVRMGYSNSNSNVCVVLE